MPSITPSLRVGPFFTSYHRTSVDDAFLKALDQYLQTELLPQLDEPFKSVEGTFVAEYNEERNCGPNSAIRDAYRLEIKFIREGSADELAISLYQDPKTGEFRPRSKGQPLFLWTKKRKAAELVFRGSVNRLVQEIEAGQKPPLDCPRCAEKLRLIDAPALFDLSCPNGCFVCNYHRDPATREFLHGHFFSRPPDP